MAVWLKLQQAGIARILLCHSSMKTINSIFSLRNLNKQASGHRQKKQAGPIGHPLTLEAGSGVGQIKGTTMLGTCPALIRRKNKQDNEEEEEGRGEIKMNRNRHDSQRKTPFEGQLETE